MHDKRTLTLLESAAKALEEGREIGGYWLRENNVTADECMPIMNLISVCIRSYVNAPDDLKTTIIAAGANERRIGEIVWVNGIQKWASRRAIGALDRISEQR
jgi:hypothetical protein